MCVSVCACVWAGVYKLCFADINLFTQSQCGDSPSFWEQNARPKSCKSLYFRVKKFNVGFGLRLGLG